MANEKRLIDANLLVSDLAHSPAYSAAVFQKVAKIVHDLPTVDAVEVVHGRWIEDVATDMIACTECGHAWNIIDNCTETFNYCPNCGAKMDGGNENGSAQA